MCSPGREPWAKALKLLALIALLVPLSAVAQDTNLWPTTGDWRVLETEHFRVHYVAPSEAWARRAAERLESIRERVIAEVGYEPPEIVDVVVADPVAEPNGSAFPFLRGPRMVLWTSPPGPESVLGNYRDWQELLLVHEETHLVHLLRPSRNPVRQVLQRVLPVGPLLLGAPRWVTEGYATTVEGRLTAGGRPNSDLRAAIVRRWAQAGKLPSYGRLASDKESWQGMSMAYLVGSAYLEWLEERAGPGSLRKLWARMSARASRSFDDAFTGVFGESPADLYDRFRAEVTWQALEAQRRIAEAGLREGGLWQDLTWTTGAPAVSPDGTKLAIVLDSRKEPAELVVWSTAPDEKTEAKWKEEQAKLLERDPLDVPAVRARPLKKEPLHKLATRDGVEPAMPRWMPDGRSVLFVRFEPDLEGALHPDLFLWTPEDGRVERLTRRLTRGADVRDPDPSPDGTWAAAVRHRYGQSQLVRVDLATGEVKELTEPSVEAVYDHPRFSPDGGRLAFVRHREGSWRLVVHDLASGEETAIEPPQGGTIATPAWSGDGRTLYAVVGDRGFIDVWAFPADPAHPANTAPVRVTRTLGGAFSPEPVRDGSGLFYTGLEPDGLDLYRLDLATLSAQSPAPPLDLPAAFVPVIPLQAAASPEPFRTADVPPGRPYGLGRQDFSALFGGSASSSGGTLELVVQGGDLLGRLDYLALGALSSDGWPEGGALAAIWRGWPVELGVHLFQTAERPSEQSGQPAGLGRSLDLDRRGVQLGARWNPQWSGGLARLEGRVYRGEVDPDLSLAGGGTLRQETASLEAGYGAFRQAGPWVLEHGASAYYEAGRTDGDGWSLFGGSLRLGLRHESTRLNLLWQRDGSSDVRQDFDRFQLGGGGSSLLPGVALLNRIEMPALPLGTLLGDEHEGQRVELRLGGLPVPLFFERHRLWSGGPKGDWLRIAGLEGRFQIGPIPVVGIPALDARVGVARVLDEPFEDDTRWWLVTVWRP